MTKYQIQNEYIPRAWEMWKLYEKGMSTADIGLKYKITRQSVYNSFKKIGTFPIKIDISLKEKQEIKTSA